MIKEKKQKLSRKSGESAQDRLRSNPRTRTDEGTAYHEAEHVPLREKGASIIQNREDGTAGRVFTCKIGEGYRPNTKNTDAARIRCERKAMVSLAGRLAQRKFNTRSVRFRHGESDFRNAVNMMSYFFESPVLEANLKFLELRVRSLFEQDPHAWRCVQAIAAALLERKKLTGPELIEVIEQAIGI